MSPKTMLMRLWTMTRTSNRMQGLDALSGPIRVTTSAGRSDELGGSFFFGLVLVGRCCPRSCSRDRT